MRISKLFGKTQRDVPAEADTISHQLLLRTGMISQVAAGVYSYLPLALRALKKIENIIRDEMDKAGGQELMLPVLQPIELWQRTGRDQSFGKGLFTLSDRRERKLVMGPTHEEVITDLVSRNVRSYRDLPLLLYQIQTKFRDEPRPRAGLLRVREFTMKDLYSFDTDEEGLARNYQKMTTAYQNIYSRCGLPVLQVEADSGAIGGKDSHEFMVIAESGEDEIIYCDSCKYAANVEKARTRAGEACPGCGSSLSSRRGIEVGHIFKLGTFLSEKLGAFFIDPDGVSRSITMGCYGIGLGRLLAAVIENSYDDKGIIWPVSIAPYHFYLCPLYREGSRVSEVAESLYSELKAAGLEVLFDDREESPGVKFNDADLLGIPFRLTISPRTLEKNSVELKRRSERETELVPLDEITERLEVLTRG